MLDISGYAHYNAFLIFVLYYCMYGDERSRRRWKALNCKPRDAELEKSAYTISAKNTSFASLPLAA